MRDLKEESSGLHLFNFQLFKRKTSDSLSKYPASYYYTPLLYKRQSNHKNDDMEEVENTNKAFDNK